MKKWMGLLLAAMLLASSAMTGCTAQTDKGTLNLMTWAEYVPSEVIAAFEAETGIKVVPTYMSTNEDMVAKLRTQKNTYDIVVCSDMFIGMMIQESGLLQEIDASKIPNLSNVEDSFRSKYFDPENKYSIPHAAYGAILAYDTARSPIEIKGYADLWDPALADSVVLLDDTRGVIGFTLQMLGGSVNETDAAKLEEARTTLMDLRQNVVVLDADTPHDSFLRGDAVAGYMFGSQVTAAIEGLPSVTYVYPEEGMTYGMDCYVVAHGAPNYDNAMAFLNYVLDGEISAQISCTINYINCNTAAKPFLTQEFLDNKTVNIPAEALADAQMYLDVGDAAIIYDDIWTEFKSR